MAEENVAQSNIDATANTTDTTDTAAVDTAATDTTETTDAETKTEETTEAKVVPETYADFTLPEGFQMDSKALEEFLPMAKELGMTQESAQKAITMHANAISGVLAKQAEFRAEKFDEVMAEIKADKVLGGSKFDENLGKINAMLTEGVADTFLQAVAQVAQYDVGKAKAYYARMDKLAREYAPDTHMIGGGVKTKEQTIGEKMYPDMKE